MALVETLEKRNLPHVVSTGPLVSLVAAATSGSVWLVSTGRKAALAKLMITNLNPANAYVTIGIGVAGTSFTQVMPAFFVLAGFDLEFGEDEIPEYWFGEFAAGNILVRSDVGAASPDDVQVMGQVVEVGF